MRPARIFLSLSSLASLFVAMGAGYIGCTLGGAGFTPSFMAGLVGFSPFMALSIFLGWLSRRVNF